MNCTRCHAVIPPDGPAGMCPKCLLSVALGESEVVLTDAGEPAPPPPTAAELQPHFPQFEILRLVGRGGMGAVYEARQKGLARSVAVKILAAPVRADSSFEERFAREAQALARLSHENIVAVYDAGRAGPHFFLAMEYVDGPNLRQAERAGHIEPAQALALVVQICAALDYAHKNGIVHRDIKPENVLMTRDGTVKIVDFGLAKVLDRAARGLSLTRLSQTMGTPHYMAPEQIEHPKDVDHRADIYSLGVVFYELLTGELPLGRFPLPSHKVSIDVRLDDIVIRTLEKEPDRRYQFAGEVRTAVQGVTSTPMQSATTPATGRLALTRPERGRDWRWVAAGVLLLLSVIVGTISVMLVLGGERMGGEPVQRTILDLSESTPSVVVQSDTLEALAPDASARATELAETVAILHGLDAGTAALRVDSLQSVLQVLMGVLTTGQDPSDHLRAIDIALAPPGIGLRTDLLAKYRAHEADRTELLPLVAGNEIAAARVDVDPVIVGSLRQEMRRALTSSFGSKVAHDHIEWLVREHMPFETGSVEIRIRYEHDGARYTVEERVSGGDVDVDRFDTGLPRGLRRIVDRFRASAGAADAVPAELPDFAQFAPTAAAPRPERGGPAGLPSAPAVWAAARGVLAHSGREILAEYLRVEAAQAIPIPTRDEDIARLRIGAFPAVRATLAMALRLHLVHTLNSKDCRVLLDDGFEFAVLPFGDEEYEVSIGEGGFGWKCESERRGGGQVSMHGSDLPEPYARLLALHRERR